MSHTWQYLEETKQIADRLSLDTIEALVYELVALRRRHGRLFIVGLGGSAGNAGHMVNDMRKLCGIEAYAPTDNVSELTARANDEGWPTIFHSDFWRWSDALFVLSVGGGQPTVSLPLVMAIDAAKARGMKVLGIVGRDGGYTAMQGDKVVIVPTADKSRVTPHTEAFQAVIWHCLVSHPDLQRNSTKW